MDLLRPDLLCRFVAALTVTGKLLRHAEVGWLVQCINADAAGLRGQLHGCTAAMTRCYTSFSRRLVCRDRLCKKAQRFPGHVPHNCSSRNDPGPCVKAKNHHQSLNSDDPKMGEPS